MQRSLCFEKCGVNIILHAGEYTIKETLACSGVVKYEWNSVTRQHKDYEAVLAESYRVLPGGLRDGRYCSSAKD